MTWPKRWNPSPICQVRDDQHVMYYGIHVKVYELSRQSRTFSADGYIWVEWDAETQRLMEEKQISPARLIRLVNQIESWDSTFEPVTEQPYPCQRAGLPTLSVLQSVL